MGFYWYHCLLDRVSDSGSLTPFEEERGTSIHLGGDCVLVKSSLDDVVSPVDLFDCDQGTLENLTGSLESTSVDKHLGSLCLLLIADPNPFLIDVLPYSVAGQVGHLL